MDDDLDPELFKPGPIERVEQSVEDLRAQLTRQVLELALDSQNPQYKLDALRATAPSSRAKPPETPLPVDAMTMFRASVRKAENGAE